ncbi:MAG: VOC family protein [Proteobacteria bacterium]|nr:VOC family protein [Pseudomonadota bacterium]
MSNDIDGFHHVGLVGRDLDRLAAQYEWLGFALTPVSLPRFPLSPGGEPEPVGAGNRHAIFRDSYLELLGVLDRTRWDSIPVAQKEAFDLDRALARYEGLHVLHLGTSDLDTVRRRLERSGLGPSAIRPFQRPVDTETGKQMMRARSLSLPADCAPEALFQIAQHETPDLVLQPRHMRHPNGAKALRDVIMCVADVEDTAKRYAAIAGVPAERGGRIRRLKLGSSDIVITDPKGLVDLLPNPKVPILPFLAGFTLAADLEMTADYLDGRRISADAIGEMLVVGPAWAGGTFIRFCDQEAM